MKKGKFLVLGLILLALLLFFGLDLHRLLTLEEIKAHQQDLAQLVAEHYWTSYLGLGLLYVLTTALSLPGATILTLVAGGIFGLGWGMVLVSFASSLGASLAFLASRYLFQDAVQARFSSRLETINQGIAQEGVFYLFTLRLLPIIPFFLINLLMGLTSMRLVVFYLVSQVGMLPGTLVYVFAGTELGQITSLAGILSPRLLLAFTLIGLFPLLAKKTLNWFKARRILRPYRRPKKFDYNLLVIGAGSAGLVSSYIAATLKAKVGLIEGHKMGGDCLNTGCVPSKALIRTAKAMHQAKKAQELGLESIQIRADFGKIMERVQRVVAQVEPHDSVERYRSLGVDCIPGQARLLDPYRVEVAGRVISARSIILATGAKPVIPPLPGLDLVEPLTSDNLWQLRQLPERLVILGGGPIGCELAQCFARLGSLVTQVELGPRLLAREDQEVSQRLEAIFAQEGIQVLTGTKGVEVRVEAGEKFLLCVDQEDRDILVPFDQILLALGRRPNTQGLGLEALGLRLAPGGQIGHDAFLRTNFPHIYCCGDVAGPYQFTHTASHQAWYATLNALAAPFKSFRVDYSVIPWTTFTDPEIGRVGLNEQEAKAMGIAYEVSYYPIEDLDRALAEGETQGFVKILTPPGRDKILGATVMASHGGEMLAELVLAMKQGLGLNKILGTIHCYPTWAEANKFTAGVWKRAHSPRRILQGLEAFHRWRRG